MDNFKTPSDNQKPFNPQTDFDKLKELNFKIYEYAKQGKKVESDEMKEIKDEITRLTKAMNLYMKELRDYGKGK